MAKHDWFDWDEFTEAAARAVWSDAWISEVEELSESGGSEGRKAYREIGPGPGGSWDPLIPMPIPERAQKAAAKFTADVRSKISAAGLKKAYAAMDNDADLMGWYAAMQSMGHGVGWGDYGVHNELPRVSFESWELSDLAADDVKEQVENAGLDYQAIRAHQDSDR